MAVDRDRRFAADRGPAIRECTVAQWRSGHCRTNPEVFDIRFSQLGEFVYHCHILEHEDGGMMARIMVVPAPN